ncbi:S1/P1 nuclease [Sphingomonas sp. PWP1-2]|uniref:S1/P1 nuclease n=1 Tax=Sphingomonas sp. PWP1-2 TaxID=2804558 RepID=UPI003CF8A074
MRILIALAVLVSAFPGPASAWGYKGHQVVADIARAELTPAVRAKVDAILAGDTDPLTGHDMAAEATWADAFRSHGHRETAQWHFVDTELDHPDVDAACFGHPTANSPASAGPERDCVIDKVREFESELGALGTSPGERLLSLKFLLHFAGDLHQPLHASDNHDRGGNCVLLSLGGVRTQNLHAYWDTTVVEALGSDPAAIAMMLRGRITPAQRALWQAADAQAWAQEAFIVARSVVYTIGSPPGCDSGAPVALPDGYDTRAQAAAALQLERAGVRLGEMLNLALARVQISTTGIIPAVTAPVAGASDRAAESGRTPASLECSAEADQRGLHGKERQRFRRKCIRLAR